MKALILAAGIGSRLSPLTDYTPKSMVTVNGKPIIFQQIESLLSYGIDDITIAVGYMGKELAVSVKRNFLGANIKIVNNARYYETNNMYTAHLCKDRFYGKEFIMLNADVFFEKDAISCLRACARDNIIITDVNTYNEESMKVTVDNGRITRISKDVSKSDVYATSIDVYKFSSSASKSFFDKCTDYIIRGELNLWSEVALNDILAYHDFYPCNYSGKWMEIDTLDDLQKAGETFS